MVRKGTILVLRVRSLGQVFETIEHMTRLALSRDTSHLYTASQLMSNFNSMPILMWLYTIAMGFLGLCLVLYGFSRPRLEEELSV